MSKSNVGLVVKLVAKAGKEEELGKFLASAEPLARGEAFTLTWFALRTAPEDAAGTNSDHNWKGLLYKVGVGSGTPSPCASAFL